MGLLSRCTIAALHSALTGRSSSENLSRIADQQLLDRANIIFSLEPLEIFFFAFVLLGQRRYHLEDLEHMSDGARWHRNPKETYPIPIVCQSWADILDGAFNEDAANEAKALAVRIFDQRLVQRHQNETAKQGFLPSVRAPRRGCKKKPTRLCSSASDSSSPIFLASACSSFCNRAYVCWISG